MYVGPNKRPHTYHSYEALSFATILHTIVFAILVTWVANRRIPIYILPYLTHFHCIPVNSPPIIVKIPWNIVLMAVTQRTLMLKFGLWQFDNSLMVMMVDRTVRTFFKCEPIGRGQNFPHFDCSGWLLVSWLSWADTEEVKSNQQAQCPNQQLTH